MTAKTARNFLATSSTDMLLVRRATSLPKGHSSRHLIPLPQNVLYDRVPEDHPGPLNMDPVPYCSPTHTLSLEPGGKPRAAGKLAAYKVDLLSPGKPALDSFEYGLFRSQGLNPSLPENWVRTISSAMRSIQPSLLVPLI